MDDKKVVHNAAEKGKALAAALAQIEKQFGKGSVMRMDANTPVDTWPDTDQELRWLNLVVAETVAAARPIIEAEVRERIASEIEANIHPTGFHNADYPAGGVCVQCDRFRVAARIARGES